MARESLLLNKRGTLILRADGFPNRDVGLDVLVTSLEEVDGIVGAQANYITQTLKIEFDPGKLSIEKIRQIVQELCEKVRK